MRGMCDWCCRFEEETNLRRDKYGRYLCPRCQATEMEDDDAPAVAVAVPAPAGVVEDYAALYAGCVTGG